MAEIIPAILPKDFRELEEKLERVRGLSRIIQIDMCDGVFVSSKTWPYSGGETIFGDIVAQERGMPYWEDFDFEFDLMVKDPYKKIQDFVSLGAKRIIVHLDSCEAEQMKKIMDDYGKRSDTLAPFDIELGLAIGSRASTSVIEPYIDDISFVQVMGIQNVGHQHQGFDEKAFDTVRELRQKFGEMLISVDGGVSEDTGQNLVEAGADRLVVGSALFSSGNIVATMDALRGL